MKNSFNIRGQRALASSISPVTIVALASPPLFAAAMSGPSGISAKGAKDAKTKDSNQEMVEMMKNLQLTMSKGLNDQGNKLDNVVTGQQEIKSTVKELVDKIGAVESEITSIKADHTRLSEDFAKKFEEVSKRLSALESSKPKWHDMAEEDDEDEEMEGEQTNKRMRNGFSMPSARRSSSAGSSGPRPSHAHSRGSSHHRSASAGPVASSSDELARSMCISGFPRKLTKEHRLRVYNAIILPKMKVAHQAAACFKAYGYLSKTITVVFQSSQQRDDAMDNLTAKGVSWVDEQLKGESHKLLFRKEKSLEQQRQGRYASHFYSKLQGIISSNSQLDGFSPKVASGSLWFEKEGLILEIAKFGKSDGNRVVPTINTTTLDHFELDKEQVEAAMRAAAAEAAED